MNKEVFSLCFMCSVRCPIKVSVKDGHVNWIEGNSHVAGIDKSLCPRGSAGKSMLYDNQRVQTPLIRVGERGSGNWRKVSWDEAIDYVADRLKTIIDKDGGHSIALGERTQLATHVSKTLKFRGHNT
jgi:thiosulfate reductase / polysulfide reductase chain A